VPGFRWATCQTARFLVGSMPDRVRGVPPGGPAECKRQPLVIAADGRGLRLRHQSRPAPRFKERSPNQTSLWFRLTGPTRASWPDQPVSLIQLGSQRRLQRVPLAPRDGEAFPARLADRGP